MKKFTLAAKLIKSQEQNFDYPCNAMSKFANSVAWLLAFLCVDLVSTVQCPAKCNCKGFKSQGQYKVDCTGKDLVEVTESVPSNAVWL